MNKSQALLEFWKQFDLPVYDENSVPDEAEMPYITYNTVLDNFDRPFNILGNVWYKGTSWEPISLKVEEIAKVLENYYILKIDGGYLVITRGTPFAQRMADENQLIKRIYINLQAEFMTNY